MAAGEEAAVVDAGSGVGIVGNGGEVGSGGGDIDGKRRGVANS